MFDRKFCKHEKIYIFFLSNCKNERPLLNENHVSLVESR